MLQNAVVIRHATPADAEVIAALHAESWRQSYRGVYSDAYLDGVVVEERRELWLERMRTIDERAITLLAEVDGTLVGFAHTYLRSDPTWGALLDNLHVAPAFKRRGVGRALMATTAAHITARAPGSGMFLWVLEQNESAQAFYRRLGGVCDGREESDAPGGGRITGLRMVWGDLSSLRSAAGPMECDGACGG